ncbi:unnamed protein product [Cylicostephanus goldi]|uniref:Uncharacterized protein n=1 Tax=Cylicostephanus goldi TaxID=71465 RepID=A0A3P6R414_CYLGO|nr:unnamed protein product [Cylicostephanus goldi]
MDALRNSIEEGIKAQEVNRRKRVQGSYECERRRKRRDEDGTANGPDDAAENESNSPTDEDGATVLPEGAAQMSWNSNNNAAPNINNDFLEEEEIVDELDLLTEEELQAEYDELEEAEMENNENEKTEQENESDEDSELFILFLNFFP